MARLVVVADADAVAEAAADRVVAILGGAIEMRGVAHLALTGGSSAAALYRALLAPVRRSAVDWRIEGVVGRRSPGRPSDPRSNVLVAQPVLEPGEGGLTRVARLSPSMSRRGWSRGGVGGRTYAARLREPLPSDLAGDPILDLVLLGMGGDGHMLSVFPGSPALEPGTPIVMAVPAPTHIEPHLARVTINPRLVAAARAVLVMCSGAPKAHRLAEVLEGPIDPHRLPAQVACGANATWIVDRAAASGLREA